jgi:tRNA nucleotidyltransferase (CCA-adding enzyme)
LSRYRNKGHDVEIALPRREHSTGEGHRDFSVQADPKMSPSEDLFRRDFSANAMAVDLKTGHLIDPYGGANDIKSGTLRSHNPESLSEDPLRVVRALVANARHGLVPDDATKQQMAQHSASLTHLPPERIQAELDKLFAADNPAQAIRLAHDTGALQYILPEVDQAFGYDQNNPHHEYELGDHLTNVLERASEKNKDRDVRLAALLHDIGKPDSAWVDPITGSNHFYKKRLDDGSYIGANHEELGAEQTNALMNRLRYPNDRIKRVTDLVQHHMFPAFTSEKGARKFLNRVGDHADDLLDIRWADQGGKSEYPSNAKTGLDLSTDTQRNLIEQVRNQQQPTNQSQLALNGNDLIQAGIPKGPQMGLLLKRLTDAVVEDPTLNTKDKLLELAQNNVNQG